MLNTYGAERGTGAQGGSQSQRGSNWITMLKLSSLMLVSSYDYDSTTFFGYNKY